MKFRGFLKETDARRPHLRAGDLVAALLYPHVLQVAKNIL